MTPTRTASRFDLPLAGAGREKRRRAMSSDNDKLSAEDRLIAEHFKPLATHPGALALTDDAALLTPAPGTDVVLTTDAIIAGVHFFSEDDARDVARKALRVN